MWQWGDAGIEVGSLVPEGFQAYARILHLAREWTNDEEARARWSTLTGLLRAFTSTPNLCWFGIWEGYGFIDPKRYKGVTRVQTQQRAYLLYRGPIQAATSFQWEPSWLSPNLWWPDDHAWCVASDIDLEETYVGGSNDCIDRILADGELDARRTTLDARVDKGGDKVSGRT